MDIKVNQSPTPAQPPHGIPLSEAEQWAQFTRTYEQLLSRICPVVRVENGEVKRG